MSKDITDVSPTVLASESVFRRDGKKNCSVLYVEGDSDVLFFERFCGHKNCKIKNCSGKDNVIEAIRISNQNNTKGEVAVADLDYDNILHINKKFDNLFYTDTHDLETMILFANTFDNILCEYADIEKVDHLLDTYSNKYTVFDLILNICMDIGYIRLYSKKCGYDLNFRDKNTSIRTPDNKYITLLVSYIEPDLSFRLHDYIYDLVYDKRSISLKNKNDIISEIEDYVENETSLDETWYYLCQGHDITCVISYFFTIYSRQQTEHALDNELKVESMLRSSYSSGIFKKTELGKDLKKWEIANPEFSLLKK